MPQNKEEQPFESLRSHPGSIEANDPMSWTSLFRYLDVFLRRWWIILICIIISIVISYNYTRLLKKEYIYHFSIFYQDKVKENRMLIMNLPQNSNFDNNLWLNIMKSQLIMQSVSDKMIFPYSAEMLSSMIKIEQKRNLYNVFYVTITATDPEIIPVFSQRFVQALNDYGKRDSHAYSDSLINILNVQQFNNDLQLNTINSEINNYLIQNKTLDENDLANKLKQLNQYRIDLTSSTIELESIRASLASLKTNLGNDIANIVSLAASLDPLKLNLMNLQVELVTSQTKYSEKHPKILALKKNIQNVKDLMEKKMSDNTREISSSPVDLSLIQQLINLRISELEYETRIASWEKVIDGLTNNVSSLVSSDESLKKLIRKRILLEQANVDIQRTKLESLVTNSEYIDHFRMLDLPINPTNPSERNKTQTLLIGMFIGLCIGFIYSIIYEKYTDKIYSSEMLEQIANCPVVCSIPVLDKQLKSVLFDPEQMKEYLLPYTILKVKVKVLYVKNKCNFIAIISPAKFEGKSTTSISLSLELANDGFKVLLIDSDLWSPSLSQTFDMTNKNGLSDYLKDPGKSVREIIYSTSINNLDILPAGTQLNQIGKLLRPDAILAVQKEVMHLYDWVIIDTPALLLVPDSFEFISFSPTILMVIRIAHTKMADFKEMIVHLRMAQIKTTGIIVNSMKSNLISKHYQPEYSFRYGYYKKYHNSIKTKIRHDRKHPHSSEENS